MYDLLTKELDVEFKRIGSLTCATDEEETGNWKWITGEVFSYSEWETGYPKIDAYYKENYLMVNHATTKWIQERNPLWLEDNNFIVEFEGN